MYLIRSGILDHLEQSRFFYLEMPGAMQTSDPIYLIGFKVSLQTIYMLAKMCLFEDLKLTIVSQACRTSKTILRATCSSCLVSELDIVKSV